MVIFIDGKITKEPVDAKHLTICSNVCLFWYFKQLPKLRDKSRRDYVKKREVDQLEMLHGDINDDEYLFGEFKLSEREKKELEYKKTVLNLAKDYRKAGDMEKVDRYSMPKEGTKPSKYDDEVIIEELGPNYEQKQWEEDKLGQAKMKFGAKDAKTKNKVPLFLIKLTKLYIIFCCFLTIIQIPNIDYLFFPLSHIGYVKC